MSKEENSQPRGFKKAKQKASLLLNDKEKLKSLIDSASGKAQEKKEKLSAIWEDVQSLLRMLKAYWKKEYTYLPVKSLLYIVAAILYFVNPLDLIPDFIPFTGLIDDLSILTFVINSVKQDIETFKEWEKETPS